MPRLNIGTPTLFDAIIPDHKSLHEFDEIDALLDWKRIEADLSWVYNSKEGGASYPPIMMFRAMLLQVWHNISDVQAEKMLSRDLLFRRFCGLSFTDSVPDHSTISRFRTQLNKDGLYDKIFYEVNRQLAEKGAIVKVGEVSIVDASVIEVHQYRKKTGVKRENTQDPEAGWAVKMGTKGRKESTYGFKVHANVDEDGFVKVTKVTAGNVHDSQKLEELLTGTEEEMYGDSAYAGKAISDKLNKRDIKNKINRRAYRNKPLTEADDEYNSTMSSVRYVVERTFGAFKRHYGVGKTRFLGITKVQGWITIVSIAHNLKKAVAILFPKPQRAKCA
jgi:transposase, IS5 family